MHILNISTDYAIRCLIYLSNSKGYVSTNEISARMSIPCKYAAQILNKLKKAGVVDVKRGKSGGFAMTYDPKNLFLIDIIHMMNDDIRINRCLERDGFCSRNAIDRCAVHDIFKELQSSVDSHLGGISFADIINRQESMLAEVGNQRGCTCPEAKG